MNKLKPNGQFELNLGWKRAGITLDITGGPYDAYPGQPYLGVCVRAEQTAGRLMDVHLPIDDFSVPRHDDEVLKALEKTIRAGLAGRKIYIGCMGGWGRTGLFMALLVKALGVEEPVSFIRQHYTPRAVETKEQQFYVKNFDVSPISRNLWKWAWKARLFSFFRK